MIGLGGLLALAAVPFVLVDPGHGGVDSGAVAGAVHEQAVNLAIAHAVAWDLDRLRVGVLVLRQDAGDAPGPPQPLSGHQRLELSRRATLANRLGPDLFVSLHANFGPDRAHGPIVFVGKAPDPLAMRCAQAVERRLARVMGGPQRVVVGDLYLLRNVQAPSMLVETGFLTSPRDRRILTDPAGQQRVALAIARGIADGLRGTRNQSPGTTGTSGARPERRSSVTRKTLSRMMTSPATADRETRSPRNSQPQSSPKTGTRKVTLSALVGPTSRSRLKYST